MCGFIAIAATVTFVVVFFTVHETVYKGDKVNYDLPESEYGRKRNWFTSLSLTSSYNSQASFCGWLGNTLLFHA